MRLIAFALLSLGSSAAAQSTWYVDVNGSSPGTGTVLDPYTSIDFALAQASTVSGDFVLVLPGTYQESVTFAAKGVSVVSTAGPAATVIDAGSGGSAVSFLGTDGSTMLLNGFTLTGGSGSPAGGDFVGGGVYGLDAIVEIAHCYIDQNDAGQGGGLFLDDCVAEVRRCRVRQNLAVPGNAFPQGGGVFARGGSTLLTRSHFDDNMAGTPNTPGAGGGISSTGGNAMTVQACRIRDNTGEIAGGGLFGAATVDRCRIEGNLSQFGGGINGAATVTDTLFKGNSADSASGTSHFGGGVFGGADLTGCSLRENLAFGEGAAANGAILVDCKVKLNQSVAAGFATSGALESCTAFDCRIEGNRADGSASAPAQGGGASNSDLIDCQVLSNTADSPVFFGTTASGGGVFGGSLTNCQVFENFCAGEGGGAAYATATGTELFKNSAQVGAGCAEVSLDRSTVYGNIALGGGPGGLYVASSATVQNSILWGNGLEIFVEPGASLSVTFSDVQGGWAGVGNILADPQFWDVVCDDFHLMAGSPCIDAGNPASPLDPDGSRADMGAHPFDPSYTGG